MQVPEILQGVGVAVLAGTAVTDQNLTRDVGELSQKYRGSFSVLAEAEDRFFSAHVTCNVVKVGPNRVAKMYTCLSSQVYISGAGTYRAQVAYPEMSFFLVSRQPLLVHCVMRDIET